MGHAQLLDGTLSIHVLVNFSNTTVISFYHNTLVSLSKYNFRKKKEKKEKKEKNSTNLVENYLESKCMSIPMSKINGEKTLFVLKGFCAIREDVISKSVIKRVQSVMIFKNCFHIILKSKVYLLKIIFIDYCLSFL